MLQGPEAVAKFEAPFPNLEATIGRSIAEQQLKGPEMILITVAPVGHLGKWSSSIEGRVICASVRSPFVAAAKALLAEGHAPQTKPP
jgi:hypothetical protein